MTGRGGLLSAFLLTACAVVRNPSAYADGTDNDPASDPTEVIVTTSFFLLQRGSVYSRTPLFESTVPNSSRLPQKPRPTSIRK